MVYCSVHLPKPRETLRVLLSCLQEAGAELGSSHSLVTDTEREPQSPEALLRHRAEAGSILLTLYPACMPFLCAKFAEVEPIHTEFWVLL